MEAMDPNAGGRVKVRRCDPACLRRQPPQPAAAAVCCDHSCELRTPCLRLPCRRSWALLAPRVGPPWVSSSQGCWRFETRRVEQHTKPSAGGCWRQAPCCLRLGSRRHEIKLTGRCWLYLRGRRLHAAPWRCVSMLACLLIYSCFLSRLLLHSHALYPVSFAQERPP